MAALGRAMSDRFPLAVAVQEQSYGLGTTLNTSSIGL